VSSIRSSIGFGRSIANSPRPDRTRAAGPTCTRDSGYAAQIEKFSGHGRRRQFVAFIAALAIIATGCRGSDGPPEPEPEDAVDATENDIGRCLRFSEAIDALVEKLPYINCTEPHTHEIYAVKKYEENKVYPGFNELEDEARLACLSAFEGYVGRSAFDSSLFYSWLVPTLDGWNDPDIEDRTTLCVLGMGDNSALTESVEGSNI
jgi:hypothetical protein